MFKKTYPFDPEFRHHVLISLGLAFWIFLFLALTEPLDTNQFNFKEKLLFLPFYGLAGAIAYLGSLTLQNYIYKVNKRNWTAWSELLFFILLFLFGFLLSRGIYLYIIVYGEQNPYTLSYFLFSIYLPAIATILPILAIGRWAFGRYFEKKLEDQKIEIEGEGTYEGLRLHFTDLIYVKADDNYVEVTYSNGNNLKKQLIRNTLSKVESVVPELLRTHRSYIINPHHFVQWKMVSGKLHLILTSETEIPVSKTYAENVKSILSL
ncbi:LytTR family DNA-binding domain-containing protein [Jejudonia soesokkakensis]|uniref:LytTR family DNA-binding domain-containing protein n=1 Tax=Jejudonia soesokkakensis TaxID=1323432 RepID=A0ABW2MU92_9FLAO